MSASSRFPLERLAVELDRWRWSLGQWRLELEERGWWRRRPAILSLADGSCRRLLGQRLFSLPPSSAQPVDGLLLDADEYVGGTAVLPPMPLRQLEPSARALVAQQAPFLPEDLRAGWRVVAVPGGWQLHWYATDASLLERRRAGRALPAWFREGDTAVPLFDDAHRAWHRPRRREDAAMIAALGAAALLLLAAAVTPLMQQRLAVVRAQIATVEAQRRAEPAQQALESLRDTAQSAQSLQQLLDRRVDVGLVLDRLAAILPDGAWLDRCEFSGGTVRLTGIAPDVAALMAELGKDPHIRDVRTPIATTRDSATGKERFTIELRWLARPDEAAP
jgi:Tfp pilus assembly protein PilN